MAKTLTRRRRTGSSKPKDQRPSGRDWPLRNILLGDGRIVERNVYHFRPGSELFWVEVHDAQSRQSKRSPIVLVRRCLERPDAEYLEDAEATAQLNAPYARGGKYRGTS